MSVTAYATTSSGRTARARATWNGVVLAETTNPVLLQGNIYFPPEDVQRQYLAATRHRSLCAWKGLARYYTVHVGGQQNTNAAWYYPHPSPLARKIKNHVAFWHGVQVETGPASPPQAGQQPRAAAVPDASPPPTAASGSRAEPCPPDGCGAVEDYLRKEPDGDHERGAEPRSRTASPAGSPLELITGIRRPR